MLEVTSQIRRQRSSSVPVEFPSSWFKTSSLPSDLGLNFTSLRCFPLLAPVRGSIFLDLQQFSRPSFCIRFLCVVVHTCSVCPLQSCVHAQNTSWLFSWSPSSCHPNNYAFPRSFLMDVINLTSCLRNAAFAFMEVIRVLYAHIFIPPS